jgi:hypothetical protein
MNHNKNTRIRNNEVSVDVFSNGFPMKLKTKVSFLYLQYLHSLE